ncbi:MAG: alpha/beta fold hydrolase [Pseudomonadota bacterium]
MLAQLQRGICAALLVLATLVAISLWPHGPLWAVAGFLGVVFFYVVLFAVEFTLLNRINRGCGVPLAAPAELLHAAVRETVVALQTFGWRQPFRSGRTPDHLPVLASGQTGPRGVVLVHGFVCNRGFWNPWLPVLRARGHAFVAVNLEPVFGSIDGYLPQVDQAVQQVRRATGQPPLLVCHSMGGLVVRAWLRARAGTAALPGGDLAISEVVTLGSPHHGTWFARFGHGINGRQMRLNSRWLTELAQSEPPARRAHFTCWYSNADNIVAPPSTAMLADADNRLITGAGHVDLAHRPVVLQDVLARLAP